MKRYSYLCGSASSLVIYCLVNFSTSSWQNRAVAQIVPDTTLVNPSVVTRQNSTDVITGGTQAGSNLFHSFVQFSVPTGNSAYFSNPPDIQNIFTRITGGSLSNIDGIIRANGSANFFLINPNGIIFGPNARLEIGGSFLATTANSLNFADSTFFSAINASQNSPLLTVSVPIGLQFGSNPGRILVQGNGQGLRSTTALVDTDAALRVAQDQTLALVGGEVAFEGATLKTPGGRIELGSVGLNSFVSLKPIDKGIALGYESVSTFGDIRLSQQTAVDASGAGGGDIQVRGRQLMLTDGSQIEASTLGGEAGGNLSVTTSELVKATGTSANGYFPSGLQAQVYQGATGAGGKIAVETQQLTLQEGAQIITATSGQGAAGTIAVKAAKSVELIGTSANANSSSRSSLLTSVYQGATGAGGNLTLETKQLSVRDGAILFTGSSGAGAGGTLMVRASEFVELSGTAPDGFSGSGLYTSAERTATGDAGNLFLETRQLIIRDGAVISGDTSGSGNGGILEIEASDSVELIGTAPNPKYFSAIITQVFSGASGDGGKLTLETGRLIIRDGAYISTDTRSKGSGGNLVVKATESVEVAGTSILQAPSGLYARVRQEATGNGGNLTLETGQLIVRDGAAISTDTLGTKPGGTLTINASQSVEVIGTAADPKIRSRLSARSENIADAGSLIVNTGQLTIRDGALVNVSSTGTGSAGNLEVTAESIFLNNQGSLEANSAGGEFGNITLNSQSLILRQDSNISTNATKTATGGNITLDINQGILAALENSDITANSEQSKGGTVTINVQSVFGSEFRNTENNTTSDITATGGTPELSGTVTINTPEVQPAAGLIGLPENVVDASKLVASSCRSRNLNSEFIVTGRGGLPPSPYEAVTDEATWVDLRLTEIQHGSNSNGTPSSPVEAELPPHSQIEEAQGWMVNSQGKVVLIAQAPNATMQSSGLLPQQCDG